MCESVSKWKLCIRLGMDAWSHPSGSFTLLGDAVHATLPYLASGAGMSLEDAAVLGECLSRISDKSAASKKLALKIYEQCRTGRTRMVVERGNLQQFFYHLHDGAEQRERDQKMRMQPTPAGEALAWRDPDLSPKLLGYNYITDVSFPHTILIFWILIDDRLTTIGQEQKWLKWRSYDDIVQLGEPEIFVSSHVMFISRIKSLNHQYISHQTWLPYGTENEEVLSKMLVFVYPLYH